MKKYLILGSPRSGTTRLIQLLCQYYKIEHKMPNLFQHEALNLKKNLHLGKTYDDRAKTVLEDTENRFVVLKCLYDHIYNVSSENRLALFDAYDHIICTSRNNVYDQILSYAIAKNLSKKGINRFNSSIELPIPHDLTIDRTDVFEIGFPFRNGAKICKMLPREKIIPVMYEDVADKTANDLLESIGIHPKEIYSDVTVKLDSLDEKWARILNKEETHSLIQEYIAGESNNLKQMIPRPTML